MVSQIIAWLFRIDFAVFFFRDRWLVFQSQRSQTEAVTFLANHDDSRALYAIPGMPRILIQSLSIAGKLPAFFKSFSVDQVWITWAMKTSCHITLQSRFLFSTSCSSASSSTTPLNVNANASALLLTFRLADLSCGRVCFLPAAAPPFTARDTLKAWQEKNHPWLELSDVHRETTENIRVTVIPFYMGMRVRQPTEWRVFFCFSAVWLYNLNLYLFSGGSELSRLLGESHFLGGESPEDKHWINTPAFLAPAVALLHPSGEHGQWGGPAEGEALEDLQPVRNPGNGPWTRGRRQGEVDARWNPNHLDAGVSAVFSWLVALL